MRVIRTIASSKRAHTKRECISILFIEVNLLQNIFLEASGIDRQILEEIVSES